MAEDKRNNGNRPPSDSDLRALIEQQQATIDKQAQEMAETRRLLNELLTQRSAAGTSVSSTDILAQEVKAAQKRYRQKESFGHWVGRSAEDRTQEAADRRYRDGTKRFRVWVRGEHTLTDELGKPTKNSKELPTGCPTIEVNAMDKSHAEGRYKEICGINWLTTAKIVAEEVGPAKIVDYGPPAYDLTPPDEIAMMAG